MLATTAEDRHRLPRLHRGQLLQIGLAVYAAIYLAWLLGPLGTIGDRATLGAVAIVPIRLLGAVLAVAAALDRRSDRATRGAWGWLSIALTLYALGMTLSAIASLSGTDPGFPSVIDASLLLFYPLAFLGLLAFAQSPRAAVDRVRLFFDVLIWVVGGGLVIWVVVIGSVVGALDADPVVLLTTLAYPLGDLLVLCGIATTTLGRRPREDFGPLNLLLLGVGVLFVDDLAWAHLSGLGQYQPGHPIDALWMLSAILVVLAAARQVQRPASAAEEPEPCVGVRVSILPYGFLVAGFVALLLHSGALALAGGRELAIGAVFLGALVVGRQVVSGRGLNRFLDREARRRGDARFRALIQHASDVILVVDASGVVRYASPSVTPVLGHRPAEVIGRRLEQIAAHPGSDVRDLLERLTARATSGRGAIPFRHADGHVVDMDCVGSDLRTDPDIGGFVLDLRDASERRAFEDQLRHQAFHDSLTGLANRTLFHERVQHALARLARRRAHTAILYLDLDDFKTVNDSLGHSAGDELLVQVSSRLLGAMRGVDTVARLGGDEFGVLVEDLERPEDAELCAVRLLTALSAPVNVGGHAVRLGASIGVATTHSPATSVDELLRDADVAMYQAKLLGKGRFATFRPAMGEAAHARRLRDTHPPGTPVRGDLALGYSPVVDILDGSTP